MIYLNKLRIKNPPLYTQIGYLTIFLVFSFFSGQSGLRSIIPAAGQFQGILQLLKIN